MDVADLTLDELRLALAPGIAEAAIFDGWSDAALDMAADQLGADRDVARLAYKDDGAMGMICAWIETIDRQMMLDLPPKKLAEMKIRERIRSLVQYRLDAVAGQEEALRRALAIMAMPRNAARALKTGWNSADDESEGKAETRAFLERRIDGVMTFERVKAKWLNPDRESFSVSRFLGRLRYPAR